MSNLVDRAKADAEAAKAKALAVVNKAETGLVAAVVRNAKWVALAAIGALLAAVAYVFV
jgi:hypothetical protein